MEKSGKAVRLTPHEEMILGRILLLKQKTIGGQWFVHAIEILNNTRETGLSPAEMYVAIHGLCAHNLIKRAIGEFYKVHYDNIMNAHFETAGA